MSLPDQSTDGTSSSQVAKHGNPMACIKQLQQAINAHDLEALVACFGPDYDSIFPAHPERAFKGTAGVRANWSEIFRLIPDIRAELLHSVVDEETIWTEWEWSGTHIGGFPALQRGVTIQGVHEGKMAWARLYIEPVRTEATEAGAILEPAGS